MRVRVAICTRMSGSGCVDEFDVDDDTTPEEIEEYAREAAFQMVEWDYEVL